MMTARGFGRRKSSDTQTIPPGGASVPPGPSSRFHATQGGLWKSVIAGAAPRAGTICACAPLLDHRRSSPMCQRNNDDQPTAKRLCQRDPTIAAGS